jgi:hypothetical protein
VVSSRGDKKGDAQHRSVQTLLRHGTRACVAHVLGASHYSCVVPCRGRPQSFPAPEPFVDGLAMVFPIVEAIFALFAVVAGSVPEVAWPVLVPRATSPEGFVPAGWVVEKKLSQDFDGDGHEDVVLLLRMHESGSPLGKGANHPDANNMNPRLIAGALRDVKGYRLSFTNHALIPRPTSPEQDDPLDKLELDNHGFIIGLRFWTSMGSWWTSTVRFHFRFEKKCFRLIGFDRSEFHRASHESNNFSLNYLTSVALRTTVESDDAKPKVTKTVLSPNPVVCIDELGDGFDYQPATR